MSVVSVEEAQPREPAPAGAGVRIFTRAPVTPGWIADRLLPAVRELREAGPAEPRLRYGWLGGPHVDVVAGTAPAGGWAAFAGSLDAGPPAADCLAPRDYLDQARIRGRLEAVPPPYLPMREHGAIELVPAADVATGPVAAAESLLSVPMCDTIDAVARNPGDARTVLTEMFVALADAHPRGFAHGVAGFREYAGAFLERWGPDRDLRRGFATRLAAERPVLRDAAERLRAGTAGPLATAWAAGFAAARDVFSAAAEPGGPAAETLSPADDPALRSVIEVFHGQLHLLTVTQAQRYYMYYAVGEAQ